MIETQAGLPLPSKLLLRDLRQMSQGLTRGEIRFLVDYYYQQQENRKSALNQKRASEAAGEAAEYTSWLGSLEKALEGQIKTSLDLWTDSDPISSWAKSQRGIGPVLAAGLAAHIDITRASSVGKLWRFAGQDPTSEWHGAKNARELVKSAFEGHDDPTEALLFLSRTTHRRVTDLLATSLGHSDVDALEKAEGLDRDLAMEVVKEVAGTDQSEILDLFAERDHVDNAIAHCCEQLDISPLDVYLALYAGLEKKMQRDPLVALLSKRPWNARLKTLCWKIGESFVYQSGHDDCFYGQLYRQYKQQEIERNGEGRFAEQAASILQKRRLGDDTQARAKYEQGQLPDAHIHARAKRRAVKMFLSHYWAVAYELYYRRPAPRPWIIEHGGHVDLLPPPAWNRVEQKSKAKA